MGPSVTEGHIIQSTVVGRSASFWVTLQVSNSCNVGEGQRRAGRAQGVPVLSANEVCSKLGSRSTPPKEGGFIWAHRRGVHVPFGKFACCVHAKELTPDIGVFGFSSCVERSGWLQLQVVLALAQRTHGPLPE